MGRTQNGDSVKFSFALLVISLCLTLSSPKSFAAGPIITAVSKAKRLVLLDGNGQIVGTLLDVNPNTEVWTGYNANGFIFTINHQGEFIGNAAKCKYMQTDCQGPCYGTTDINPGWLLQGINSTYEMTYEVALTAQQALSRVDFDPNTGTAYCMNWPTGTGPIGNWYRTNLSTATTNPFVLPLRTGARP